METFISPVDVLIINKLKIIAVLNLTLFLPPEPYTG